MPRAPTTTDVFSAIAEPRRREIVEILANRGPLTVGALVVALGLPQPVGVVRAAKDGRQRKYQLEPQELKRVHDWAKKFEHFWSHQLDRIKERAERKAKERS
jgi:hypothetical protein